ncbi:MAG: hypothetical protein QMD85_04555 [Candidatus Aenigmarchaeota archaeon]|nr:hypothetical protein [Candidatus Aenigmarchaeota archaeon]
MKWQPVHGRKKLGLALLKEERLQETATEGLKELFDEPELKPIEANKSEIERMEMNEFTFMSPEGIKIANTKNLKEFLNVIPNIPKKSVIRHINNGDFSKWFYSLGHKKLAENVRNIRGDKKSVKMRLINACNSALVQEQQVE